MADSNTTLVKVKLSITVKTNPYTMYSNTTLVKVKYDEYLAIVNFDKFKYNSC